MSTSTMNVNSVVDNAKFTKSHFSIMMWCLILILFDGYDLAINGVALPLLMKDWGLTAVQAGMLSEYSTCRDDVWCHDVWYFG